MKSASAERRRERRQRVENEKLVRQAEREAAWRRRSGRRIVTWKCRRGDSSSINLDFRRVVVLDFDPECDRVEDVPALIARQVFLFGQSRSDRPN